MESDDKFEDNVVNPEFGLFVCSRTSGKGDLDNLKPCAEAFKVPLKNPIYYDEPVFVVRMNTLKELMDFVDRYGECVIGKNNDGFSYIEIYDDYRE